jgi:hypothetical protein
MSLGHPSRAKPERIGKDSLLEKISEHHPLRRHNPIDLGLTNRKKNIESHSTFPLMKHFSD